MANADDMDVSRHADELRAKLGRVGVWSRAAETAVSGAAALGEAFDDRFVLGLGISLVGGEYAKPLTTMRRYLDAMDEAPYAAWSPQPRCYGPSPQR